MMNWLRRVLRRLSAGILFSLIILLFVIVVLWESVAITIPAGHSGVMWYRFFGGTASSPAPAMREGIHLIFPWDKLFIYNMRLQVKDQEYQVVSQDGLHFNITLSFRWEPIQHNLGLLHRTIGPDYEQNLLIPEIGSVTRHVVSRFTAVELFSPKRQEVQDHVYQDIVAGSLPNGIGKPKEIIESTNVIQLNNILIKEVQLPDIVRTAIERKLEQQQVAEEYKFRVAREHLESDRKAVEAQGIRRFQETVAPAITDSYLRWRGIEATLELAKSKNSKVVVIGNGPGGLPIILNGVDREAEPGDLNPMQSIVPPAAKPSTTKSTTTSPTGPPTNRNATPNQPK